MVTASFAALLARRRMCRSFSSTPLDGEVVDRILAAATRAPSAGNTDGLDLLVLEGDAVARYWDITLPSDRREGFRWPGLLRAPLLVIPIVNPGAYVKRYGEPDKARTGLGESTTAWPVPYWTVDGAFAAMLLQLAALDEDLGVLFFGLFDHADAVMDTFAVPAERQAVGVLAIGHPDGDDEPGRSAGRGRRSPDQVVHRERW